MDEYIKRETLLRIAKKLQGDDAFGSVRIVREIENAPAEDVVEVRHGKWLTSYDGDIQRCSICNIMFYYPKFYRYKYCPNCGAKMDLEEEYLHD